MSSKWVASTSARVMFQNYLGLAVVAPPGAFYLALSSTSADPAVGFTELTVANYVRMALTWSYGGDVYATNSAQIDFTNLGAGTVLGQGIYTASTAGTLLWWSDLVTDITFTTGHNISYSPGAVKVGLNL